MIWHFLEVWFLVALTFAVGCVLGAYLYFVVAETRFAVVQGTLADHVGDGLERIRSRFGSGPVWRRSHAAGRERPAARPRAARVLPERIEPNLAPRPSALARPDQARALPPPEEQPKLRSALLPLAALPAPEPIDDDLDPERAASAMAVSDDGMVPKRPAGLNAPRAGIPDNLTRIRGVGRRNEQLLNSLGVYHFGQIAAWTPAEVRWIGQYLAFPERIERDDWVGQATILASGGDTGFEKSAERRRRRRQQRRAEAGDQSRQGSAAAPLADPTWSEPVDPPLDETAEGEEPGHALQMALAKVAAAGHAMPEGEGAEQDEDWLPPDEEELAEEVPSATEDERDEG